MQQQLASGRQQVESGQKRTGSNQLTAIFFDNEPASLRRTYCGQGNDKSVSAFTSLVMWYYMGVLNMVQFGI